MNYHIHSGRDEIGHMCIEVAADDGTRILLDMGMPLATPEGDEYPRDTAQRPPQELIAERVLPDVQGLYPHDPMAPAFAAIVLTHSHLDHYGLVHHAHPEIPVYGSAGTIAILEVGNALQRTPVPADLRRFPEDERLTLGGLTVTAIPVDHAAPDSRALLVEADGQRLLYTGDLRAHGRTGYRFEKLLADERLHGVDWLLREGTTLGSSGGAHGLRTEADVEEGLLDLARREPDKLIAVAASGQNLDRLVSCYRAARRSDRQLVVDAYQGFVLEKLNRLSRNIPQSTWENVRVSFPPSQVERFRKAGLMDVISKMKADGHVTSSELAAEPGRYLVNARGSTLATRLFDKIGPDRVAPVWSMWRGYWDRGYCAWREWAAREGVDVAFIHSGGHAWPEDLKRLEDALGAGVVVPVHTDLAHRRRRAG